jgi:hypothetical protein
MYILYLSLLVYPVYPQPESQLQPEPEPSTILIVYDLDTRPLRGGGLQINLKNQKLECDDKSA